MKSRREEIKIQKSWIYLTMLVVFLAFTFAVYNLYQIQISDHEYYLTQSNKQNFILDNKFDRGSIYFTNKNGDQSPVAILETGFILAVVPDEIKDSEQLYLKLNQIITLDQEDFLAKANKKGDPYEEIVNNLTRADGEKVAELKLDGVRLTANSWREYPIGSRAAQTVGFLAYQNNQLKAQYGLERYYNNILARQNKIKPKNIFVQFFGDWDEVEEDNPDERNGDIVVTLEPSVQKQLEQKLGEIQNEYQSELTGGIIMNPQNGEIYAMGAVPSFDLNNFASSDSQNFINPLVENVYEMGSIIKPLTIAAALDAGKINQNSVYYDTGCMTLNNKTFCNYDGLPRYSVSVQEILNQSLNTGVAYLVQQLGRDKFRQYFYNFGLNSETGIDLPNEATPLVSNLSVKRDLEYAQASFGQGIAISPIQTVRALAALGNGGKLVQPHLLKEINYEDGSHKIPYYATEQILLPETSQTITNMLIKVVDNALLQGAIKYQNYTIAAKTGTAQVAGKEGYNQDDYLHSFFGYFPATDPQFIIFLYTVKPKGVDYASHTLTYPFRDLVDYLINYYQIIGDR